MMKAIIILVAMAVAGNALYAQSILTVQSPCAAAAQGTAGNFVISYTIGEMPLVSTEKSNGLVITQGILQPFISIADTVYECFSQTEVRVYPNPTPGIFSLQLSMFKVGTVKTVLYDAAGKMLQQDDFAYNTFATKQYNIQQLANGRYYLQLFFTEAGNNKAKKCAYTIQKLN
jgi:hypothetical protein